MIIINIHFFIDGNFKVRPKAFKQIMTIMTRHKYGFGVPLFYVLLMDKKTEKYRVIFNHLKEDLQINKVDFKKKNYNNKILTLEYLKQRNLFYQR